jgi:protein-tyrosine phosphatase
MKREQQPPPQEIIPNLSLLVITGYGDGVALKAENTIEVWDCEALTFGEKPRTITILNVLGLIRMFEDGAGPEGGIIICCNSYSASKPLHMSHLTALIMIGCLLVKRGAVDTLAKLEQMAEELIFDPGVPRGYTHGFDTITWLDMVHGFAAAGIHGLVPDLDAFSPAEYKRLICPDTHDATVIIPGLLVALADPVVPKSRELTGCGGIATTFAETAHELRRLGVRIIVNLNHESSNVIATFRALANEYREIAQVNHLSFPDMTSPSTDTACEFARLIDTAKEMKAAVAVHCRAGLGRTGTLICCYLIKAYGFTAPEAVGYLRLLRPYSVFGDQVKFLHEFVITQETADDIDVDGV